MTTPTKTRRYYAMTWKHGIATYPKTGHRIADYVWFPSRAARDAWVQAGANYRSEPDYREPVAASDADLRRTSRAWDARNRMTWQVVLDEVDEVEAVLDLAPDHAPDGDTLTVYVEEI